MRIQYWPALVCGWMLAALIGQTVIAGELADEFSGGVSQADDVDEADSYGDTSGTTSPGILANSYHATPYGSAGVNGGQGPIFGPPADGSYPPGITPPNPWPETSPFTQHRIEETYNEGGSWKYNSDDEFGRKYYFNLAYLYGHGSRPGDHLIGDYHFQGTVFLPGDIPHSIFPTQKTDVLGQVFHNGVKPTYGFENPDGSGAQLSGFILFENNVNNGLQMPFAPPDVGLQLTLASIIVSNGAGGAIALPFDTRFYQQFTQEILGSDADFFLAPFFSRPALRLKAMFGAKYLRVHEDFLVQASDSGLGYTVLGENSITVPFTQLTNPYTTQISSSTTNNLVGPMLGVRYDLGGDLLKIFGMLKVGALADVERIGVASSNVVQYKAALPLAVTDNVIAGPGTGGNPVPITNQVRTNTHVSPVIDLSINGEFPFFQVVPYINQWALFKNAYVRIGYNYVGVGEIARAASVINYNITTPTINTTRTWFSYNAVNFAVNWKF